MLPGTPVYQYGAVDDADEAVHHYSWQERNGDDAMRGHRALTVCPLCA
jgi:hypothetical protein